MPGLDELRFVLRPPPRRQDAVDPVAGVGKDVPNVPRTQSFKQVVSYRRCHVYLSFRAVAYFRSPLAIASSS
jgi:hypothetical protein